MKKTIKSMLIATSLCIGIFAGIGSVGARSNDTLIFPYERGQAIVNIMDRLTKSDDFIHLYINSDKTAKIITKISEGNYKNPEVIYKLELSESGKKMVLAGHDINSFSAPVRDYLNLQLNQATMLYLNAIQGADALAATNMCTITTDFVDKNVKGSSLYLYVYKDSTPVMIAFSEGEDHAVRIVGTFLINVDSDYLMTKENAYQYFDGLFSRIEPVTFK